ncbi:uncharacterized protein [Henckelia pumila]|uniref:uncharacterized protein n=1 Tax=Henckelia pumila TaxID=405737 RepID=UPI003C6E1291
MAKSLAASIIVCSILGLFYSTKTTPFACSSNETDLHALLALKAAVFDPLGALNSWNDTRDYCRWSGVICGSEHRDRVVEINLMSRGLLGSLSPHVGNLSFLKKINLQNNSFHGQIPQQIGLLRRLEFVECSNNSFGGEIPRNLSRCSNLVYLNLIDNRLRGSIPAELGFLRKLEQLGLSKNNLSGTIPPFLGNLTSLEKLSLMWCGGLSGEIPESLVQLRSLKYLILADNSLYGGIPSGLFNISTLLVFGVSGNQLQGTMPFNIGITLPNLRELYLGNNQFSGVVPVSLSNATFLEHVSFYSNSFKGHMPKELGRLSNLRVLIASDNLIQDDISFVSSFTNCTKLRYFGVGDNMLHGSLPDSMANLSSQIEELEISGTQVHGKLPPGIGNLFGLFRLLLNDNNLEGAIPFSIGGVSNLQALYLEGNRFTSSIPYSWGNLTLLNHLRLEGNNLSGSIPRSLGNCTRLLSLNLANNNLGGSIPPQIMNLSSLSIFFILSGNDFTGSIPTEVGSFKNLANLHLSNNRLSGLIPETLGGCTSLGSLHLEGNLLEGEIPPTLGDLKGLQDLDLSRNNLSGRIPNFLSNLNIESLNLSFNRLSGEVPLQGVFRNKTKISLEGNTGLCGGILELKLPLCPSSNSSTKHSPNLLKILIPSFIAGGLCITLCVSLYIHIYRKKIVKANQSSLMLFDGAQIMRLSYRDLFKATGEFSECNLVGAGRFGRVYKAILEDGKMVAVKVLNLFVEGSFKSFLAECNALKGIRHRNLLKLLSICESIDFQGNEFKALIYEFMAGGSLEKLLYCNTEQEEEHNEEFRSLDLLERLDIIIDIAHALEYLHNGTDLPIIHGDLKSSNILLDQDMTAHVGDFGLSKVVSNMFPTPESSCSTNGIRGTLGFVPPEYGTSTPMSIKGDVYSFGILVLEILTGRRPTDEEFKDNLNIHNFVSSALPYHAAEIVDPLINHDEFQMNDETDECVASMLSIGVACSREVPSHRMPMSEVVREICKIRDEYAARELST